MNRLVTAFVLFTAMFHFSEAFTSGTCHAQTFNFIEDFAGINVATLTIFDLPADDISDFGVFRSTSDISSDFYPASFIPFGPLRFSNFSGELSLVNGELQAVNGDAILSTGTGLNDLIILFPDGSSVVDFSVGTFFL